MVEFARSKAVVIVGWRFWGRLQPPPEAEYPETAKNQGLAGNSLEPSESNNSPSSSVATRTERDYYLTLEVG